MTTNRRSFAALALTIFTATLVGCTSDTMETMAQTTTVTTTATTMQVSTVTDTVEVTVEAEATETPVAEPSPPVMTISPSQQDKIYGEVIRGYGVDISDVQVAAVSGPVCDSYDAGGGLDSALAVVQSTTGHTGWQATKIVQGAVVGRCSQYAELTY